MSLHHQWLSLCSSNGLWAMSHPYHWISGDSSNGISENQLFTWASSEATRVFLIAGLWTERHPMINPGCLGGVAIIVFWVTIYLPKFNDPLPGVAHPGKVNRASLFHDSYISNQESCAVGKFPPLLYQWLMQLKVVSVPTFLTVPGGLLSPLYSLVGNFPYPLSLIWTEHPSVLSKIRVTE